MGREWYRQTRFDGPVVRISGRLRAMEQEEDGAKRYGGRVKPGSGASPLSKGDVQTRLFLMEMKGTVHNSLRVSGDWLVKITREARWEGRDPAVEIRIRGIEDPLVEDTWVMVPASVFRELNMEAEIKRVEGERSAIDCARGGE